MQIMGAGFVPAIPSTGIYDEILRATDSGMKPGWRKGSGSMMKPAFRPRA